MDWNDLRGRVVGGLTLQGHDRARSILRRIATSYLLVVVVGIVIGLQVAPATVPFAAEGTTGTVAIIPLGGGISGASAAAVTAQLQRARHDPEIDAVVLLINSPGGTATASESLYLQVKRTADEMPVVAYVDAMAASGAYYAAVGADHIMTKPASLIGSVGVIFVPPQQLQPIDGIVSTGPNKLTGADEREWLYKTENIQNAFVSAVMNAREDNLTIPQERVAEAEIFTGAQAVDNGMADEIGGLEDAAAEAARRAGFSRYDVKFLFPDLEASFLVRANYLASQHPNKTMGSPVYFIGEQTRYPNYLMLPPGLVQQAVLERADQRAENGSGDSGEDPTVSNDSSDDPNTTAAPSMEPVPNPALAGPPTEVTDPDVATP